MTSSAQLAEDWIKVWIDGQRAAVDQWLEGQKASAATDPATAFGGAFQQSAGAFKFPGMGELGNQIGDLWRSFSPTPAAAGLPGLGPLKEQQEALQEFVAALGDYQRLSAEMARVLAKVLGDTLDLLGRRSLEQANSGRPVDSFKALYDLWIECGEVTYAKVVQGDTYCRLQADLCNAGVRVQGHQQQLLERWLKQADLPTRSELNTLHQRVRELKKKVDTLIAARDESPRKTSGVGVKPASPSGASRSPSAGRRASRQKS